MGCLKRRKTDAARRRVDAYSGRVAATILIVDDEREIRELLRYNLERQGYQVLTAQDGEEGLARIFATHPDLVLLDLLLPGLNGLEVLRELRQEPSTRDLPVLLLTARGPRWTSCSASSAAPTTTSPSPSPRAR
jgi:CheY-like chemotaxis protein